jgi:hypothetical protein
MLAEIDEALRDIIYREGRIDRAEVDIQFDAPNRSWIDRLVRPTVNCFLFGMQENGDLRQTSFQATRVNGRAERRLPPRRIDLHYMVSAHTTEPADEHRLLWRVLATLLRFPEFPSETLPDTLRDLPSPLTARTGQADDSRELPGLWGTLGIEPHPAIAYVITAPLDTELTISAPLVLTRTVRFGRSLDGSTEETNTHVGGIVRAKDGTPVAGARVARVGSAAEAVLTNAEGEFTLLNVPSGPVDVRVIQPDGTERTVTIDVPSGSYEIVLT